MKSKKVLKSGFHVLLWKEDDLFVAKALEVEVASQGKTKKETLASIEEALELYFEGEKVTPDKIVDPELHTLTVRQYA